MVLLDNLSMVIQEARRDYEDDAYFRFDDNDAIYIRNHKING